MCPTLSERCASVDSFNPGSTIFTNEEMETKRGMLFAQGHQLGKGRAGTPNQSLLFLSPRYFARLICLNNSECLSPVQKPAMVPSTLLSLTPRPPRLVLVNSCDLTSLWPWHALGYLY